LQHFGHVEPELIVERLVEREFLAHAGIDIGQRPVADDGQHRIDRNHPPDQEGD
jgi:hypothetical protein